MKKLFTMFAIAAMMFAGGCNNAYDDSALTGRVDNLENRVAKLEELCKQMNTNISSLQTIVNALQNNDYVTGVAPVTKNGETIGYTISFTKSAPITIYHGENGKDGMNGSDGKDGVNGKDGHSPIVGVRQDTDGVYYWTLDGEWLLDNSGNKVKAEGRDGQNGTDGQDGKSGADGKDGQDGKDGADGQPGKDGITPQLKIENGYWFVSTDGGTTWTQLGKATGEDGKDGANGADGKDGDSFFQSVDTSNGEYVVFTLADGTTIKLPTWYAFEQLRTLCNQMNTNISSLQTIVEALQQNDYLTSCTPLTENGKQIGYTITFAKSGSIVIYHGQDGKDGADGSDGSDGKDGADGSDGSDGKDGKDGHSPVVGVKADNDGTMCWTLDGEWLLDDDGNKIPVHGRDGKDGVNGSDGKDGQDGIAPQLKIENGYWFVSTDGGTTWTQLGKATGEDGKDGANGADGDAFFQSVTQDEDYIHIVLSGGEKIDIPKHHPLSVAFDETEDIRVLADKTYPIGYTITGADDKTVIKALAQDGFRAVVKKTDNATGVIEITTPSTILPTEVLVFVTDGRERTIMRSINFVEGVILIASKSYSVGYGGGTVEIDLSTNIDYTVEIPEADKEWISLGGIAPKVVMRDETVTLTVAPNPTLSARYSTVKLVDALGIAGETILITQKAGSSQVVEVAKAGTLEERVGAENKDIVEELTLTGTLNTFDFDFIRTMKNLKLLDLSGLDNTTLPSGCFANSTIATILLPMKLTAIPNRAFYQAAITSIYIPETVETIGDYAFYQCKSVAGNLVIPDATTSIGAYCFQQSTFDGTLTLGNGLQTIGEKAFYYCYEFTGDLIIPDSVTTLGESVFQECRGFTGKLVVGNGVIIIPQDAFYGCSGLAGTITLGENITSIAKSAFYGCSQLTGNLIIPDKVTTINSHAFADCINLTGYLSIGCKVTNISRYAFARYVTISTGGYTYESLYFSKYYCKALTPPNIAMFSGTTTYTPGTFGYGQFFSEVLYVPKNTIGQYKQSYWGSYFTLIEEIEF